MIETFFAIFFLFTLIGVMGLALVFALFCTWVYLRDFNVEDTTIDDFLDWVLFREVRRGRS